MSSYSISIIIATRNRQEILWETVEKACSSIGGKNVEIILINDGDANLKIPQTLAGKINYYKNPGKGVSAARNFGVAKSKGDMLFFVDDDMWIVPEAIDWIESNMKIGKNQHAVFNLNWEYPPGLHKKLTTAKVGRYVLQSRYNTMWGRMQVAGSCPESGLYRFPFIASCSLLMHRDIFNRLGGYNEQMIFQGEDIDVSNRLAALDIPVFAVFDVTLFHNHQDRIEITGYLNRLFDGYSSEFKAAKAGLIKSPGSREYNGLKKYPFELMRIAEPLLKGLYGIIPNSSKMNFITHKLTGILAGLTKYKAWRAVYCETRKPD